MQPPSHFNTIQRKASERWNQLEGDPELAGPWHQLFRQVQSPRHVVSELLQNADDAGATWASARIEKSTFVFEHDGADFSVEHLGSLCRFGFSNKRTLHTIGFRGVGFKSTFSLGDIVEVRTATLAFRFQANRFTEPQWLPDLEPVEGTRIQVRIQDKDRETQLKKNFDEWSQSAASLLFFSNLKQLAIDGTILKCEDLGDGPVARSSWTRLGDPGARKLLVIKSEVVEFPDEAASEVCAERGIASNDLHLPPCHVEIVLGFRDAKRLYVVLPTGAEVNLPFSCNAPFIQDPARFAIKDPATSPTNRWLLERAGRLAGSSMIEWLQNDKLSLKERADAYQLLKGAFQIPAGLNGACTKIIMDAMLDELDGQPVLLTTSRKLVPAEECCSVPQEFLEVWDPKQVASVFTPDNKHLLASEVLDATRSVLESYGWLKVVSVEKAFQVLEGNEAIPRPPWPQLHALWQFVESELRNRDWNSERRRRMKLVPVEGSKVLHAANKVVRLSSKRDLLPRKEDWKFIMDYAPTADADWLTWLSKRSSKKASPPLDETDTSARLLQALSLHEPSPVDRIATLASLRIFTGQEPTVADCVRIAHIMAALGATIPSGFRYVAKDLHLRDTGHGIVVDETGQVEDIVTADWSEEHLLHEDYYNNFQSCSAQTWKEWCRTPSSGLLHFVPLGDRNRRLQSRESVTRFVTERGAREPKAFHYRRDDFTAEDYGFPVELVDHWEALAKKDPNVWANVLKGILTGPAHHWKGKTESKILHNGTTYSQSLDCGSIPALWIVNLRGLACMPDSHGKLHSPAELLIRTPDTEPLMGVEPFVQAELDTEANRALLKLLNVRDRPVDADKLLKRLQSLSGMKSPSAHLLQISRLYEALDRIAVRCSSLELRPIIEAFRQRPIILTDGNEWLTSGEVSIFTDEDNSAPSVHSSLRSLSLWLRIGVSERPALERTIEWLKSLSGGTKLDAAASKRVRSALQRDPARIWNECQHWLTLDSTWESTDDLKFRLTMQSLTKWGELFPTVKRETANLQMVGADIANLAPFSAINNLSEAINFSVSGLVEAFGASGARKWLVTLAEGLSRVRLSNDEDTDRVRAVAKRLQRSAWRAFTSLNVTPCIEGVPAGESFTPKALWQDENLYLAAESTVRLYKDIADELARPFAHAQVLDAIAACIDRDSQFVTDYLDAHFELEAPVESKAGYSSKEAAAPSQPTGTKDEQADSEPASENSEDSHDQTSSSTETQEPTADQPANSGESTPADNSEDSPKATDEDPSPEPASDEPNKPEAHQPKPSPPPKPTLIELYAKNRGFRWQAATRHFVHLNKRTIKKSESPFNWEEHGPEGDIEKRFWSTEQKLANGIEVPAELWTLLGNQPESSALILVGDDNTPRELTGTQLLELKTAQKVRLHPATYRIVEAQTDESYSL